MGEAAPSATAGEGAAEGGNPADEVVNYPGSETGEEFIEATPEQLSAEAGEETAVDDPRGLAGFESSSFESGEEGGVITGLPLQEAGEASAGVPADSSPVSEPG